MMSPFRIRGSAPAIAALLILAACSSSGGSPPVHAATAKSAADVGGMSGLIAAAKAEGQLNVIGLPADWANYGAIISAFSSKYGISINSENPVAFGQEEVDAVSKLGTSGQAPDVLDLGMKVALANTSLFAAYEVATWGDIYPTQKDPGGLWYQDYGGYMAIGYDSSKVPEITDMSDLLGARFHGRIALTGDPSKADPTKADAALFGVLMASLGNGGSLDDVSKGIDFFHQLKLKGNLALLVATSATVKSGTTSVVLDWDYLSKSHLSDVPTWKIFVPSTATLGLFYAQAINKHAPHPAAARLWEEYLYSDEGQNLFLRGGKRPVREAAMRVKGTLDTSAAQDFPVATGTPVFATPDQLAAAASYLTTHWARI
jgi:putative spermidine/putrescine transport system substrate-binding protein